MMTTDHGLLLSSELLTGSMMRDAVDHGVPPRVVVGGVPFRSREDAVSVRRRTLIRVVIDGVHQVLPAKRSMVICRP
jgi:hypothetical protein